MFDGSSELRLKSNTELNLGADGEPFKLFDYDDEEVPRDNISEVYLRGDNIRFGVGATDESWTVGDAGIFHTDLNAGKIFALGGLNGGKGTFSIEDGATVVINNAFDLGGNAGDGELNISGGLAFFGGALNVGGSSATGTSGAAGSGVITISGDVVSHFSSIKLGGNGPGYASGDGGDGELHIAGGTNFFRGSIDIGGAATSNADATDGGDALLKLTGGTNVFDSHITLSGNASGGGTRGTAALDISGGEHVFINDVTIGNKSASSNIAGTEGTLTVSGGYTSFIGSSSATRLSVIVGGPGDSGMNGRGYVEISGGALRLENVYLNLYNGASENGAFDLKADGMLIVGQNTKINAASINFDGTLGFDLSASQAFDSSNIGSVKPNLDLGAVLD